MTPGAVDDEVDSAGAVTPRFWPFSRRSAFLASLVLVPACVVTVIVLDEQHVASIHASGWTLLAAVLVGLVPIILVVLGGVRTVQAAGVTVAFAAVQDVVASAASVEARRFLAANLGQPPGPVVDSARDTIIEVLGSAVGNEVVVLDLKEGDAWWETRLLLLVTGAARLQNPSAVVFTAARPDRPQTFVGWAKPSDLRRRLLEARPALQAAVDAAQRDTMLWALSSVDDSGGARSLPWAAHGKAKVFGSVPSRMRSLAVRVEDSNSWDLPWPSPDAPPLLWPSRADRFVPERFLLTRLTSLEEPAAPMGMSEQRVHELFDSVLFTDAVDRDAEDERWVSTTIGSTAEYFAVTSGGQLVTMILRSRALNAVLLTLLRDCSPSR